MKAEDIAGRLATKQVKSLNLVDRCFKTLGANPFMFGDFDCLGHIVGNG